MEGCIRILPYWLCMAWETFEVCCTKSSVPHALDARSISCAGSVFQMPYTHANELENGSCAVQGVTEANFRPLMAAAGSLAGLAQLTEAELVAAMGGVAAARKLREWLDATCPVQRG